MEAGSAAPRVDRPVYPRRADHNTPPREGIGDGSTGAPALRLDEPKNGVAVVFARSAQRTQPVLPQRAHGSGGRK